MHLRFKHDPTHQFHVEPRAAEQLIASGLCEKVPEVVKPIGPPDTRWQAGYIAGDSGGSLLCITAHCRTCKQTMRFEGATVHKNKQLGRFCHCGVQERIPDEVAKQYGKLLKKEQPEQQTRTDNPSAVLRLYGIGVDQPSDEVQYVKATPEEL